MDFLPVTFRSTLNLRHFNGILADPTLESVLTSDDFSKYEKFYYQIRCLILFNADYSYAWDWFLFYAIL